MLRNFCHKFVVEGHNSIELITFIFPSYALGAQLDQSKLFYLSELCPWGITRRKKKHISSRVTPLQVDLTDDVTKVKNDVIRGRNSKRA